MKVGSEVISLEPHRFYSHKHSKASMETPILTVINILKASMETPILRLMSFVLFTHPLKEYYVDSFSNPYILWPEQAKNFTCIIIIYI
jgi:hypothetical protein